MYSSLYENLTTYISNNPELALVLAICILSFGYYLPGIIDVLFDRSFSKAYKAKKKDVLSGPLLGLNRPVMYAELPVLILTTYVVFHQSEINWKYLESYAGLLLTAAVFALAVFSLVILIFQRSKLRPTEFRRDIPSISMIVILVVLTAIS